MIPGGPTEIISQFAGHLHLTIEEARARLEYNDGALKAPSIDYVAQLPSYQSPADLDDFPTHRLLPPEPVESASEAHPHLRKAVVDKEPGRIEPPARDELEKPFGPKGGGGGGGGGGSGSGSGSGGDGGDRDLVIKITYGDDSLQLQTSIHQLNMMSDDDRFGVPFDAAIDATFGTEQIQELINAANEKIPVELAFPEIGTAAVAEFVESQDVARTEGTGHNGAPIEPGIYVNGVLQPADYARPQPPEEKETAPDTDAKGQWMELGGNTAANAALIVDINEAAPTLIVQGDFFKTNAFVQINAFVDNDKLHFGNQLPKTLVTDQNTADNIAEFTEFAGLHGALKGFSSGPTWNVDVVECSLYDINILVQENHLKDNDIVAQTNSASHFMISAGENGVYNLIDLKSFASSYDVIIVGGNVHAANLIFQTNILVDSDVLKIVSKGDSSTLQSVFTGENSLLNDGTIITYGNNDFQPLTADMKDLIGALDSKQTTLDPSYGELLPRNGPGPLDVLYIKGDFFDINAIWQTNIVSDLDTALQLIGGPNLKGEEHAADEKKDKFTQSASTGGNEHAGNEKKDKFTQSASTGGNEYAGDEKKDKLTQSASTGGNELSNFSTIVDVGSTFGFIDGELYDDCILVQMNVVTENNDSIVKKDTDTLVSEVIAFTGTDEDDSVEETFKPMPIAQDDMMGGVVT